MTLIFSHICCSSSAPSTETSSCCQSSLDPSAPFNSYKRVNVFLVWHSLCQSRVSHSFVQWPNRKMYKTINLLYWRPIISILIRPTRHAKCILEAVDLQWSQIYQLLKLWTDLSNVFFWKPHSRDGWCLVHVWSQFAATILSRKSSIYWWIILINLLNQAQ